MLERLPQGVQRARADVAVDDAEGPDGQAEQTGPAVGVRVACVCDVGGWVASVAHESASLRCCTPRRAAVQLRRSRAHNGGETKGVRDAGQYR